MRRLVDDGLVVGDRLVTEVLRGGRVEVSERTVERRFRAATGLSLSAIRQIERARTAAVLLSRGAITYDAVRELGYYDEPHLARSLRRYVGLTARQLRARTHGAIGLDLGQRTTS